MFILFWNHIKNMTKHSIIFLIVILSYTLAHSQFVVKDLLVVNPQASIFDPEYNTKFNIVCWKSEDNHLWVSGLDPVTHYFEPPDGKGTLVSCNMAPNNDDSWNGPEWMLSSQGTQIVYTASIWWTHYPAVATQVIGGWENTTLTQYPNTSYVMATSDYSDSTARLLFQTSDNNGIFWVSNTNLNTFCFYPDVTLGFFADDNHQICCAKDKSRNPGFIEVENTLPYFTAVSEDTIGAPCMWNDPETSKRLFMYRTNGFKTLKIFEEISPDFWALYHKFDSPLPEPYHYITSPEPFTCGGRSYISFMAAQSSSGKDGLPAQIWVAGANPNDSLMWRVSDSSIAVRTDPEPVVFSDSAFIYYSRMITDDKCSMKFSVRKCDTGLANIFATNRPKSKAVPEISVFPNPCSGRFTMCTDPSFGNDCQIKVFDMAGKLVYSQPGETKIVQIDISNSPPGNYTLKVSNGKNEVSGRVTVVY